MAITRADTELGLTCAALQQTAVELLRCYRAHQAGETFEPLDVDAVAAWGKIATGTDTLSDLDLIRMRKVRNAAPAA
jgi:hypothetical protein